MGINLGAALGPAICSVLGEKVNWRLGFGAAGVGMILGLIQFHFTKHHLGDAGLAPARNEPLSKYVRWTIAAVAVACFVFVGVLFAGAIQIDPPKLARALRDFISAAAIIYFAIVFLFYKLDANEKRRVGLIVVLFAGAALFWAGFEQVGSSFNLFAERHTNRALFGFDVPAGWFQTLGPIFIVSFAPVVASAWVWLARRNANPSIPVKFGLALLLLASGFVVMALAAGIVANGSKAGPGWLVATYFLHTIGELCLSPVGLSSVTKLSPKRLVGQMMGVWFLGAALGNLIAGLIAGTFSEDIDRMSGQFLSIAIVPTISGILLIILAGVIRRKLADA